ncbi:MAG: hypothetical protein PHI85_05910 [Victivallaceae bacterium]|nr:hypothetical protein [Victivallaceae bacterium]
MGGIFALFALLVLVCCELWLGSWHLFLPLAADAVFYFCGTRSWKTALILAAVGGAALDLAFFRDGFFQAAAVVVTVPAARLWIRSRLDNPVALNAVYGFFLPWFLFVCGGMFQMIFSSAAVEWSWRMFSLPLFSGVLNGGVLVLLILLLDRISGAAGFDTFAGRSEQRRTNSESGVE